MKKTSLLQAITYLTDLVVYESVSFEVFVRKMIRLVSQLIPVDSCFIYIRDSDTDSYLLVASKNMHRKEINNIRLASGEGITGWVAKHNKPVIIYKNAYNDKRFKHFIQLKEDRYEAFLSIPIVDQTSVIGVINLQNKNLYKFNQEEVKTLEMFVKIISSAFKKNIMRRQIGKLESEIKEGKTIETAKRLLMKKQLISEQDAYKLIRSEAMKKRKSKYEIAQAILLVWG